MGLPIYSPVTCFNCGWSWMVLFHEGDEIPDSMYSKNKIKCPHCGKCEGLITDSLDGDD